MAAKQEYWNLEQFTETEIYAAISYLDPDAESANELDHPALFVICVSLVILIVLELVWFYR